MVCTSPAFGDRCDGDFDAAAFLNQGGHILIEGGDASDEAKRVMLRAIAYHIINLSTRGKLKKRVGLWEDEAHEFAGRHECVALREMSWQGVQVEFLRSILCESSFGA
jgi:hypothetical protein